MDGWMGDWIEFGGLHDLTSILTSSCVSVEVEARPSNPDGADADRLLPAYVRGPEFAGLEP